MKKYNRCTIVFILLLIVSSTNQAQSRGKLVEKSIPAGGVKRTYLLYEPAYRQDGVRPLVIALHGGGGKGEHMVKLTKERFNQLADGEGFLVAYPDAIEKQWNDGRTNTSSRGKIPNESKDDVGFIAALIDDLVKNNRVDPQRVFVTGMSNGAMMTYRLACELSEKIAAAAPVAGDIAEGISSCTPQNPVSMLIINNTRDPLVPWNGGDVTGPFGRKKLGKVLSVKASVDFWVKNDSCDLTPEVMSIPDNNTGDGSTVTVKKYKNGKNHTEVYVYSVEGGGHTWPGGLPYLSEGLVGKTNMDFNACEVIWEFFKNHPFHPN